MKRRSMATMLAALSIVSCRIYEPSNRPLDGCRQLCEKKNKSVCSSSECERGCEFALDRIIEGLTDQVLSCVRAQGAQCKDPVWAHCSTLVGPHSDGGPPPPPPPTDDD